MRINVSGFRRIIELWYVIKAQNKNCVTCCCICINKIQTVDTQNIWHEMSRTSRIDIDIAQMCKRIERNKYTRCYNETVLSDYNG